MKHSFYATAFVALMAVAVFAADEITPTTDAEYAFKMAQGGMLEVKAGELAQQRSSNEHIKNFGARMVADHSTANSELTLLAAGKGWSLPESLDQYHQHKLDKLSAADSAAFDQEYTAMMMRAHDHDAELFRSAAANANDLEFKAFAEKTLAVVERHQGHAQRLAIKMGIAEAPVNASFQEVQTGGVIVQPVTAVQTIPETSVQTIEVRERHRHHRHNDDQVGPTTPEADLQTSRLNEPDYSVEDPNDGPTRPEADLQTNRLNESFRDRDTPTTSASTQDATRLTNRAPNNEPIPEKRARTTTSTTQDATRRTNRAPQD